MNFPAYLQADISVKLDEITPRSRSKEIKNVLFWPEKNCYVFCVTGGLGAEYKVWTFNLVDQLFQKLISFHGRVRVDHFQIAGGYLTCTWDDLRSEEDTMLIVAWKDIRRAYSSFIVDNAVELRTNSSKYLFTLQDGIIDKFSFENPERGVIMSSKQSCKGAFHSLYCTKDEERLILMWFGSYRLYFDGQPIIQFCIFCVRDLDVLSRFKHNEQSHPCCDASFLEVNETFLIYFPGRSNLICMITGEVVETLEIDEFCHVIKHLQITPSQHCLVVKEDEPTEVISGKEAKNYVTSVGSIDLITRRYQGFSTVQGADIVRPNGFPFMISYITNGFIWLSYLDGEMDENAQNKWVFNRIQLMWDAKWPTKMRSSKYDVSFEWI